MRRGCHLAAVVLVLLAGCDQDRVSGNSVETENTLARSLSVDSILPSWNRPTGGTVATLHLNTANFPFASSSGDGSDLRFELPDGSAVPFSISFFDSTAGLGRVLLRIADSVRDSVRSIRMSWSNAHQVLSDSSAVWSGLSDSTRLLANSALVDDFEDGDDTNALPAGNTWYTSAYGSSSSISGIAFDTAGLGRTGRALHVTYTAPSSSTTTQYALVATYLGSGPDCMRSLDSLVFWVRGSGTLYVALEHLTNSSGPKAWLNFSMDSTAWVHKCIRPSDFDPADSVGNNYGWSAVKDSVTTLTFFAKGGSSLWLDDIRLHGVNRDDIK